MESCPHWDDLLRLAGSESIAMGELGITESKLDFYANLSLFLKQEPRGVFGIGIGGQRDPLLLMHHRDQENWGLVEPSKECGSNLQYRTLLQKGLYRCPPCFERLLV